MATRFYIDEPRWASSLYKIRLGQTIIPVRNPSIARQWKGRERMVFTWPGGGEYTVTGPNPPHGAIKIISPEGRLWPEEGRIWWGLPVVNRRVREDMGRQTIFLWHMEDQIMTCDVVRVFCRAFSVESTLTLREGNGRRLATWFVNREHVGILREDLREDMKPVAFAMILSSIYKFCPSNA